MEYNKEPLIVLKKLKKVDGSDSNTFVIKTNDPFDFMKLDEENNKILKPHKAPRFKENEFLHGTESIIKSIDFNYALGWTLTIK